MEKKMMKTTTATTAVSTTKTTDYKRTLAFLVYGSLYQGISQEFIYNHLYPAWFGTGSDISTVLTKVGFDLCIQTTLVTLPVAYIIKGLSVLLLSQHHHQHHQDDSDNDFATAMTTTTTTKNNNVIVTSLQKYWNDVQHQQLLQKYFALWGPVQCLTFGVVPEHYRVTFVAVVSFFWLIAFSTITNNNTAAAAAAAGVKNSSY